MHDPGCLSAPKAVKLLLHARYSRLEFALRRRRDATRRHQDLVPRILEFLLQPFTLGLTTNVQRRKGPMHALGLLKSAGDSGVRLSDFLSVLIVLNQWSFIWF